MKEQVRVIRTERIWLKPRKILRESCHMSKNLFNEANYVVRQAFFNERKWMRSHQLQEELRTSKNFTGLPFSSAQKIIQIIDTTWKSFFSALSDWKTNPQKYFEKPRIPKYKRKDGQFLIPFTKQQIKFTDGVIILPPFTGVQVKTRLHSTCVLIGARIIPKGVGYVLEILYSKYVPNIPQGDPVRIVGIDIGLTNLITMVNNIGKKPIVVKGGPVKSVNQYYNKERARLQGVYDKQQIKIGKKILKLTDKRNRKINNYFHEVSRFVINWCKAHQIDSLIIGHNKQWKQHVSLGKRINQNFVLLPFHRLIQMIQYKAMDEGIKVIVTSEYYTSKCSFLDGEEISNHSSFLGERIIRGLFQSKNGRIINSDVNGGYNIIKKEVPNAFSQWETTDRIEGVWLHPVRWKTNGRPVVC